ncbi:MAG TPA: O-antigen ligase family protein [Vicinamibacterales bacterium]|nr:O-antigen ligase family protein [Vicinamibacterales bacterium]
MTERLTFNTGDRGALPPLARKGAKRTVPDTADAPPSAGSANRPGSDEKAFFALLAFTAMLFFRPQDTIRALGALHLAEICALAGLVLLASGRLSKRSGRREPLSVITPELTGIAGLGVVILATIPFSIWPGGAMGTFKELYLKILLIYLLMVNTITSPRRLERFTWLIVLASGYIALRTTIEYARGLNLAGHDRAEGAVGGIFGNPNDLALNMVAMLPLALLTMLRPAAPLKRLLAAGCALFMLIAIVASHSRSGALGFVAMLVVLAWYAAKQRPGAVVAGVMIGALALPLVPASYWTRMESITDASKDETGSRETRRILLHESFQAFVENPLVGVGAGQFKNWNPKGRQQPWHESHDVWLQVGAELGIGGLAVFLFLVIAAVAAVARSRTLVRRARGSRRRPPAGDLTREELSLLDAHSAAMAASIAGWIVCALFASVAYNWTFYYVLALAATSRDILRARVAVPSPAPAAPAAVAVRLETARA